MSEAAKRKDIGLEPKYLSIEAASQCFAIAEKTIRNRICTRELIYGKHYLKFGRKVLIIPIEFNKYILMKAGLLDGVDNS